MRAQIDAWAPDRDHTSDGTIGDAAHQAESSGHNPDRTANAEYKDGDALDEVRAIDVDTDLRNGATAQQLVDHIVGLKPSSVLRYVIYNRRIWEAGNGWASRAYTGASAHTEHVHFSGAYTQAADSNTTFNYRLGDIVVALSAQDKKDIIDGVIERLDTAPLRNGRTLGGSVDALCVNSVAALGVPDAVDAVDAKVDEVLAKMAPEA